MDERQGTRLDEVRVAARSVVLASADAGLRQRLSEGLSGMRWTVGEASGGADAMAQVETMRPEALVVDSWLPDLEVGEFTAQMRMLYPSMDVLRVDSLLGRDAAGARSPRRNEILHALRTAQDHSHFEETTVVERNALMPVVTFAQVAERAVPEASTQTTQTTCPTKQPNSLQAEPLPDMVGGSDAMRELARLVRLVAPRRATVLIEGETGTGKELVAKAVHRLSPRASKPFTVLNCAAIPESLLEAELFGHTRGAFTGAVQSRTGRIEAAHGGTLFLDEIGEMPLALQAKMLRFLESGELQKVGENEIMRVDVRVVAATHQHLEQRAEAGTFRLDLFHRLAVFPVEVPALRERPEDLRALAEFFLDEMGREMPRKTLSDDALSKLHTYGWPGNVRELKHVLARGAILAGESPMIGSEEIRWKVRRG
jgi:transcriptional regulator with GAF, ATPase, and Fis domain